jgi:AraC-like DNA-binding protein/mannose-6-phosphate isomerase-like protein (cupin superfamily)
MHKTPSSLHKTPDVTLGGIYGGAYQAPAGHDFPLHRHTVWELVYYRSGRIDCIVGESTFRSHPGMILLTPPGTSHAEIALTAYSNFFVGVQAPREQPWPLVCFDDSHQTFRTLFQQIVRETGVRDSYSEEIASAAMRQLDLLFRRAHQHETSSDAEQLVREAETLMAQRIGSTCTVLEVARELGVSPSSLREKFGRLRGQSPHAYLQQIRVNHALTLLRNSTQTLEAIATQSGFDSASHLSRTIKRATGHSPGHLRRHFS